MQATVAADACTVAVAARRRTCASVVACMWRRARVDNACCASASVTCDAAVAWRSRGGNAAARRLPAAATRHRRQGLLSQRENARWTTQHQSNAWRLRRRCRITMRRRCRRVRWHRWRARRHRTRSTRRRGRRFHVAAAQQKRRATTTVMARTARSTETRLNGGALDHRSATIMAATTNPSRAERVFEAAKAAWTRWLRRREAPSCAAGSAQAPRAELVQTRVAVARVLTVCRHLRVPRQRQWMVGRPSQELPLLPQQQQLQWLLSIVVLRPTRPAMCTRKLGWRAGAPSGSG